MEKLPFRLDYKTEEVLEKRLKGLNEAQCFNFMGKYLAKETNKILENPKYKRSHVLVRICSDTELYSIKDKAVSELGSDIDYGDDDPNRGFEGKKMYFFNLDKIMVNGEIDGNKLIGALRDRFNRVQYIHNARAREGLERMEIFDRPCFAIAVLPESVRLSNLDKVSFGKESAYNNVKEGGSAMLTETVFTPEIIAECGVVTCHDLYTELRSKIVDNPEIYEDIVIRGSTLLKGLTLNILNEMEKEKALEKLPRQAKENISLLKSYANDKESLFTCLEWYCANEQYRGLTAETFLDIVCTELSLDTESAEVANLRVLAQQNDAKHQTQTKNEQDALYYSEQYDDYGEDFDNDDTI